MSHDYQFALPCPYHNYNYRNWAPGRWMEPHSHDYLQIIHVVEGDFAVDCGDGWQTVKPGFLHILPAGFTHGLRTRGGHKQFGLNFTPLSTDSNPLHTLLCQRYTRPSIQPAEFSAPLKHYLHSPSILPDELTELKIIHMFDHYCLSLLDSLPQNGAENQKERLLSLLEAHATETLPVSQIAIDMNMSRATLQRFCADTFGCGAHTLHERIRMEYATRLLYQPDITVSDCAIQCGYADIYSFSRAFKRIKGIAPSRAGRTRN